MPDDARQRLIESIVLGALEREPDERERYVRERCAEDEGLVGEVLSLLEYAGEDSTFLEPPTSPTASEAPRREGEEVLDAGVMIAGFRIDRLLGAGGMGAVYLAQQSRPSRLVALKLIRAGLFSKRAQRRFELESEILARLQHPGIARVYESGVENGTPYFAMEYVRGRSICVYAEDEGLDVPARLELFARVCDAVQHAHTKGVVHRDLKPANILVDEESDPSDPHPKVLDFGVARLTDADTTTVTSQTEVGQLLGTVPYMSPEQAAGDPDEIDTRSDVYALGVVLYELLTGRLPYDVGQKLLHEALRIIREDEPSHLSSVRPNLRGDVETIVAKALEKEKDRRYQAATDLAQDVRRFLSHEPIAARPPSTWYQIRKFSRRNKAVVLGVCGAFAALTLGLIGTSYGLVEANRQRTIAAEEQVSTDQVVSFLADDLLIQSAPTEAGRDARVIDLLERAAERIDATELTARAEARVRESIGLAFLGLGRADRAEPQLHKAIELLEELGLSDGSLIVSHAEALYRLRRFDESLELAESVSTIPTSNDEDEQSRLDALAVQASCFRRLNQLDKAATTYEQIADGYGTLLGADDINVWITRYNLAMVLEAQGDRTRAIAGMRDVIDAYERIGPDASLSALNAKGELAFLLLRNGEMEEAELLYREILPIVRERLGPEGRRTILTQVNLAKLLTDRDRPAEAAPLLESALRTSDASASGPSGGEALEIARRLALCYEQDYKPDRAVEFLDERLSLIGIDPSGEHEGGLGKLVNLRNRLLTDPSDADPPD